MRVIRSMDQVGEASESARREALSSFADDALFVERYVERPRHIEVQIVADAFGNPGGLGGCPHAKSATGNLATEDLVWMLDGLGIETGVDIEALVATSVWLARHLGRPSPSRVVRALGSEPIS